MMELSAISSSWKCPSNIALVKYWGKLPGQIPRNPSLSISLSEAYTETCVKLVPQPEPGAASLRFRFESQPRPDFEMRILGYLNRLERTLPWLLDYELQIESRNTFPHSAGIASSASAFGALALCLADLDRQLKGGRSDERAWASHMARIGSGSASRSLFGGYVIWGKVAGIPGSDDEWALPLGEDLIHEDFRDIRDTIVIVSDQEKPVSSSMGHQSMEGNPYAAIRYQQAGIQLQIILKALRTGDWELFSSSVEQEAFSIHAMMMLAADPYFLVTGDSLHLINKLKQFRRESGLALTFTLDAGPNLHILHPPSISQRVDVFLTELKAEGGISFRVHRDGIGPGPERLHV